MSFPVLGYYSQTEQPDCPANFNFSSLACTLTSV